ncbi:MAG: hypothetical protein KZQ98_14855 [Candidatus Thiodiazotropha sp. (ex Lucinoma borealis)]|nr:hypothetical protein [Candidatus Thiodiazotropha sp. (ex Lucinoma borealis)]
MNRQLLLGFKAFDVHELLCHFAARKAGYYQRRGLNVLLRDITFTGYEHSSLPVFSTACAAGLMDILSGKEKRLLLVVMQRPLFWLFGGAGIENIEQLDGSSVAGYVDFTPPAHFLNWILADVSLDRTPDIQPVRDDLARLGLLLSGEVDAGLFSSAVSPAYLETCGLNKLSSPAELLQFPTTGLTTEISVIEQQPELVEALVAAHAEALALLRKDVDFICSTIKEMPLLGDPAGLIPTLRGALTEDGHVTESVARSSLQRMAQSMGCGSSSLGHSALFDFSALNRFLN